MFQKLRTVIYTAKDLPATKEWYIKATGQQPYFDELYYVGFDINGFELGLDPNASSGPGNQTVSYWAVDDTEAVSKKLVAIGGTVIQPRTNVGGEIHVAIIADPFGNHIGLIDSA